MISRADFMRSPMLAFGLVGGRDKSPSKEGGKMARPIWNGSVGFGDPIDVCGCRGFMNLQIAYLSLDSALLAGIDQEKLHWKMSPAQRYAVMSMIIMTAQGQQMQDLIEQSIGVKDGEFLGMRFLVDPRVPRDEVWLCAGRDQIVKVTQLCVPAGYENLREVCHR